MGEVVRWEEPPDKPAKQGRWARLADELRVCPGQWALVDESYGLNGVTKVRQRFGELGLELRHVTHGNDRTVTLYARYVGEDVLEAG